MEAQNGMYKDIEKGRYKHLCPRKNTDGIYVVEGRGERWMEMSHNKNKFLLLPYDHRFSRRSKHIHRRGHLSALYTASNTPTRFWIVKLLKMVKSIRYNCVIYKELDKKLSEQVMGKLPVDRLKTSPAWTCTAIDLFGPFKIRGEVKKRTTGKTYGVIFNCLGTRVGHVDLATDYSTEKFLMVLRRFASICIASWLAQLVERRAVGREVEGSSPGRTNTKGLEITEEKVLPFYDIKKWIDILVFSDKDE